MRFTAQPVLVALTITVIACGHGGDDATDPAIPAVETPRAVIDLPAPRVTGAMSLEVAIDTRRSQRSFTPAGLSRADLGQLLWAAQGITQDDGPGRAAPSAGGTYPLEVFAVTPDGGFRYLAAGHQLEQLTADDLRDPLAAAALDQRWVAEAAAVIVIGAVFERTESRYGERAERYGERAERYVVLEAGHAAQNVLLQAVALGLAAVPVGAFGDDEVRRLLGLSPEVVPLYLLPIGHPVDS